MANSISVQNGLNDLPDLVLAKILDFLEVFEQIRMMSVCKRWKALIELQPKHLCVYHSPYPVNRFWLYPNRAEVSDLDKVKLRFRKAPGQCDYLSQDTEIAFHKSAFWKCIRKLDFYSAISDHCYLSLTECFSRLLNSLHQLNELAFDGVALSCEFGKIELGNLKAFTLNRIAVDGSSPLVLSLATPKLERISYHLHQQSDLSIRLLYPEAVKCVCCFRFDETFEKCSNLEHLSFEKIQRPDDLLANHRKLKRIEAFPSNNADVQCIQLLRSQKHELRRGSLELFISGSLEEGLPVFCFFKNENPLSQDLHLPLQIDTTNMGEFLAHYRRMVRPVPVALGISDYPNAVEAFGGRLPSNFAMLFPKIRELVASKKVDGQLLFEFLRQCKTLSKLELTHCELGAQFYSGLFQMKSLLVSLEDLSIGEKEIKLSFEFLARMKNLEAFRLCVGKERSCDRVHLQVVVNRDNDAPCGPNAYLLYIYENGSKVFDGPVNQERSEQLESLVARLHQHESVHKILD